VCKKRTSITAHYARTCPPRLKLHIYVIDDPDVSVTGGPYREISFASGGAIGQRLDPYQELDFAPGVRVPPSASWSHCGFPAIFSHDDLLVFDRLEDQSGVERVGGFLWPPLGFPDVPF
jgi:hypothetical protein